MNTIRLKKKVACDESSICDFTGKNIERGEILIGINNISLKSTEAKSFENLIRDRESNMHNLCSMDSNGKCHSCNKRKNVIRIDFYREYIDKKEEETLLICENCSDELIHEVKKYSDEIRDGQLFNSDSGYVFVCDNSNLNSNMKDSINNNYINDSISVGITIKNDIIMIRLDEFERFASKKLKNNSNKKINSCKICNVCLSNGTLLKVDNHFICNDCSNKIIKEVESYIEENKRDIVSRSI